MSWIAAGVAGATLVGGIYSSSQQSKAANNANNAQIAGDQAGIAEQQRQFDSIQKLLLPYVTAGNSALTAQGNLAGINGNGAQQSAISALQASPLYQSQLQAGNNNILQNASATGGLRGGNVQGALAQFSPALLAQTIQQQYSQLGGLTSLGQNSAAMTGQFGQQSSNNITNLLGQQGQANAGNALAQGNANIGYANAFGSALGAFGGLGGFGGMSNTGGNIGAGLSGYAHGGF